MAWALCAAATAALAFAITVARRGHVQACTDALISVVLLSLGAVAAIFEAIRFVIFPLNWGQRWWLRRARADVSQCRPPCHPPPRPAATQLNG